MGISKNIPTDAIAEAVYATYTTEITSSFEQEIISYVTNNQDFGIKYNYVTQEWQIIPPSILDLESQFNVAIEGKNWIIALINNGNKLFFF